MIEPEFVFTVDRHEVNRRRVSRGRHLVVDVGILLVALLFTMMEVLSPATIGVKDFGFLSLAILALIGIGSYALWFDNRALRRFNRAALSTTGIWPPFKPKRRLYKEDWFVPYRHIVSMVPVAERDGFVPAYDVTLRDGLTFQLSALDLLVYVGEKEVRRYAKMLGIIRAELERPENREKAERGKDVVIPKDRFEARIPDSA